jgi:hypothetical protein
MKANACGLLAAGQIATKDVALPSEIAETAVTHCPARQYRTRHAAGASFATRTVCTAICGGAAGANSFGSFLYATRGSAAASAVRAADGHASC